jgi:D-alanyl-lipoteichoic acid acyltransferase DltB (MBOAT superfamily)
MAVFTLGRIYRWDQGIVVGQSMRLVLYSLDMWMALRLVTLIWEVGSGVVKLPALSNFILWTCLPFTIGGPLLRYSQFPERAFPNVSMWKRSSWWADVALGAIKLAVGLALAPLQFALLGPANHLHLINAGTTALLTGPIGFYLTTAGYFSLMQTLGGLCGFKLPVSFNSPIGRENLSAFWANWNMTATAVFRDYLFYNRWGTNTYNVYLNTMVLFVLMGLWHEASAYWILFGFIHGMFFCAFLLWKQVRKRFEWSGTPVSQIAARVLTYVCVCAAWYLPSKILSRAGLT